jgi:hypothetical protein
MRLFWSSKLKLLSFVNEINLNWNSSFASTFVEFLINCPPDSQYPVVKVESNFVCQARLIVWAGSSSAAAWSVLETGTVTA